MKRIVTLLLCLSPFLLHAQIGLGIKAGLNFVNVTDPAGINASSRSGHMFGAYFSPRSKKIIGFRSELILSRQGYDFKSNSTTGTVDMDYLLLPQLFTITFANKFEIHLGGQLAFLLNAKADSANNNGNSGSVISHFNRFDPGLVGGIQVALIKRLFIGARINIGLNEINLPPNDYPPNINYQMKEFVKSNVVQLYAGLKL